jgi:serine/threonine protein kinase
MAFRPATFGKYVLLKRIAIGGMAEVFRSKAFGAEGFEKLAAVKRMLPHLSSDSQFVDMFINEAKLAANLNHANIVQIYDFGCIDNLYFISMEYIHGKDIADIIRILRDRNLAAPLELACHIFIEVLNGLDYAHRLADPYGTPLDLIHRDMSPHNIILSYEGEVKIADFGIAKATSTTVHTTGGVLKGKYSYMSPEQAHGKPLDHRSDVFSLAICFYELLTLTKMFHAESDLSVLEMVRETKFTRPRELNESIPEELEDIMLKALEKNPEDRYATAGEMRDELERFLFSSNLHFSTAWLAGFMREIFRDDLDQERDELAEEHEVTQKLRSEARRAARIEEATIAGPDTVVIKRGSEPSPPDIDALSVYDEREREDYTKDTIQGKASRPGGLIVVDDDQLMDMDEGEELESLGEMDDETMLETHRMERPDPAIFDLPASKLDKLRRRSPIREVSGPPSRETGETLDNIMESPGSGEMAVAPLVAADFEKDRSTIPEPGKRAPISSGPTDIEDSTLSGSSPRAFPFGILFIVLLVAVVGGGIAAFMYHSGNDQESAQAEEVDPARLDPKSKMALKAAIEKEATSAGLSDTSNPTEEKTTPSEPKAPAEAAKEEKPEPAEVKKEEPKEEKPPPPPPKPKPRTVAKVEKKPPPPKQKPKPRPKTSKRKKRRKKPVAAAPVEEKGFGTLDVGVSGGWAFVYIDNAKIRTTPLLNYQIKAGKHKVELRDGEGRVVRRWNIRLRANERVKLLHQ